MKGVLVVMTLFLVVMIVAAGMKGEGLIALGFKNSTTNFLLFIPVLVLAFLLMGFTEVLLPQEVVQTWLSDAAGFKGMGIAWLAGALTPGGSIIGMPLVAALAKAGVGSGVLVTYLVSLATLSIMRAPLEIGFYGWRLTLLRVISCALLPFIAGGIARLVAPYLIKGG